MGYYGGLFYFLVSVEILTREFFSMEAYSPVTNCLVLLTLFRTVVPGKSLRISTLGKSSRPGILA
ncbi:hypothetical protein HMPREF9104_00877 [Lentilactobacillus kisonensis F0435]|uniref:Uncharacterized protein n=1 Tax=Lentilactobacillus kisonensis F0435 TaxID=797516 RepID=H1LE51_9LACO|nr:hypothetical protein HMPREF9104_00877 [Lentilactobacillus kisonensis F0435]